jgi:hypothetical protein
VRTRRLIAHLAVANGVLAWIGVVGLVGGGLSFGDELDHRLPWDSPVLAGIALGLVVALPLTGLAHLARAGDRRTASATVLVGAALVGWIAVQLAILRAFSWFQPAYTVIGLWFVALGMHLRVISTRRFPRDRDLADAA